MPHATPFHARCSALLFYVALLLAAVTVPAYGQVQLVNSIGAEFVDEDGTLVLPSVTVPANTDDAYVFVFLAYDVNSAPPPSLTGTASYGANTAAMTSYGESQGSWGSAYVGFPLGDVGAAQTFPINIDYSRNLIAPREVVRILIFSGVDQSSPLITPPVFTPAFDFFNIFDSFPFTSAIDNVADGSVVVNPVWAAFENAAGEITIASSSLTPVSSTTNFATSASGAQMGLGMSVFNIMAPNDALTVDYTFSELTFSDFQSMITISPADPCDGDSEAPTAICLGEAVDVQVETALFPGSTDSPFDLGGSIFAAQTFQATATGLLSRIDVEIFSTTTPGTITLNLYKPTGTFDPSAPETLQATATFANVDVNGAAVPFIFDAPVAIDAGTSYALFLSSTGNHRIQTAALGVGGPYAGGTLYYKFGAVNNWETPINDLNFTTYILSPGATSRHLALDVGGNASLTTADLDGGSSDACGGVTLELSTTAFSCSDIGAPVPVTLTVTDQATLTAECTVDVTVVDPADSCVPNQPPTAVCKNVTVNTNTDCQGIAVAADFNNGSSDPDLDMLTFSVAPSGPYELGTTDVVLTVSDGQASSPCNAKITVEDNVAPMALCTNLTVQLNAAGNSTITVADVDSGSSDACGIASTSLSQSSFGCADVGPIAVTLTVTDNNDNPATCTSSVTIEDNVVPTALCQNVTVQLDADGNGSTTAAAVDNGSNDACGIASTSLSQTSFDCTETGPNPVTLTVTDNNGNSATCTATVTVEDDIDPTALCLSPTVQIQADGTYTLQEGDVYDAANSSDNCGIISVDFPATIYDCQDVGMVFPVEVTVSDQSGRTGNCIADVTVSVGNTLPAEWSANDIGNPGSGSDYSFDPCAANGGGFTITSGGYNLLPNTADEMAFAALPLCGNGGIQARIESVSGGYAGLMIRESSAPGAKMTAIYTNLTNLLRRETRYTTNGARSSGNSFAAFPTMLRLVRQGNWIRGFYKNSSQWILFHQVYLPMEQCVEMGLAVFTIDPNGQATATFGNVNSTSNLVIPTTGGDTTPAALSALQRAKVSPNPTSGAFTLDFERPLQVEATAVLRNELGQAIQQLQLPAGTINHNWDSSNLPRGLYFLEFRGAQGYREVLKIVRQ